MAFSNILVVTLFITKALGYFVNPECTETGVSCLDCSRQKVCIGPFLLFKIQCEDSHPYCNPNNGLCADSAPLECRSKDGFQCPAENGTFPDIEDNTGYYVCKNATAERVECAYQHIYNQTIGRCVMKSSDSTYESISCGSSGEFQEYPGDPSLYYRCVSFKPQLYCCPEYLIFNSTIQRCQNICTKVDTIPNFKNCSEYISCEIVNRGLRTVKRSCPQDQYFNRVLHTCTRGLSNMCFDFETAYSSHPPFYDNTNYNLFNQLFPYVPRQFSSNPILFFQRAIEPLFKPSPIKTIPASEIKPSPEQPPLDENVDKYVEYVDSATEINDYI